MNNALFAWAPPILWVAILSQILVIVLIDTVQSRISSWWPLGVTSFLFIATCLQLRFWTKPPPPPPQLKPTSKQQNTKVQIAIVGGGFGGAFAADTLRQVLGDMVDLTVFDDGGGRVALIETASGKYECGGAVVHKTNKHMQNLVDSLGFETRTAGSIPFSLFDGKSFLFSSSKVSILTTLRLLFRYGWALTKIDSLVGHTLNQFGKIYDLQRRCQSFDTVDEMLTAMGGKPFSNLTQENAKQHLTKHLPELLVDELVAAAMRCNYGQTCDNLNAFTALVSLAGAQNGSLWQVVGGNQRVVERAFSRAKINSVSERVLSVRREENNKKVSYKVASKNKTIECDFVIIAHPLEGSTVKFEGFKSDPITEKIRARSFRKTVSHFVEGTLRESFVAEATAAGSVAPKQIFTTANYKSDELNFNSIGLQVDVRKRGDLANEFITRADVRKRLCWKIFADHVLSENEMKKLFSDSPVVKYREWLAYPHYSTPNPLDSFVLDSTNKGVVYVNAIEQAASAMEMSAIGGTNAALLIRNELLARGLAS